MAKKDQQQAELKRESRSRAEPITLRLNEIRIDGDRFCHRDPAALEEKNLKPLMESLVLEGQLEAVEVFRDADQHTLIRGHRRITAMRKLAEQNMPGFTTDMPVRAHLVTDASPADLIVRSVGDNMNRSNLAAHERIRAAKTLKEAKVPKARAARALCISETSYDRALLIAMHAWMYDLVAEKSIDPTPAFELLQAAQKKERLEELQEDLGDWVAARKLDIRRKQRQKADVGKELSEAESQVRKYMPAYLWKHWKRLIEAGKRFDESAEWKFGAELDREKKKLVIQSANIDLGRAKYTELKDVARKLAELTSQLAPYLQLKKQEEQMLANLPPAEASDFVRRIGLPDLADEMQRQQQPEADGEPDAETTTERFESELAGEFEQPPEQGGDGVA